MSEEVKDGKNPNVSLKTVERPIPPMAVPGHKKMGGMKKGYKAAKTVIREMMREMNKEVSPAKRTRLQAMVDAQIYLATKNKDREALKFILEQSGEYLNSVNAVPQGNFFGSDSIKQIINNNFVALEDGDEGVIEEESTEVENKELE